MDSEQRTIEQLELGAIRAALKTRARTPLGQAEAERLGPLGTPAEARDRIDTIRQVRGLLTRDLEPPVAGAQDVHAALDLGTKGVTLDGPSLRAIADTMNASSALRRFLLNHEAAAPSLYGLGASLADLGRLAHDVSKSFDPDGQLSDDASPDLGPLRQRLRSLHGQMREKLGGLLQAPEIKPYLQEAYFTIRADRYVLPVKTSYKREISGIVHDASASGQTVFIEPQPIVDLGNRLKIAQSEVAEEEYQILTRLTKLVVAEAEPILHAMGQIAYVDLITSAGKLGEALDASPIGPADTPGFDLIRARHPLLLLQQIENPAQRVVANDLGLKQGQLVLVLTGPNTGGKTVAMKTVGLLALMVRCGLHVPCDTRSKIGWFTDIEAAIGDQQSIASNLSTFAAHMRQIMSILARASSTTLVLLDEIAADTDPSQGQALAQSILEAFAERGAITLVTTHYERLKTIPFVDSRFRNAGVGFDPERLRPTYRITLDVPQSSSGIDIASSMGLMRPIVERARGLMGEGSQAIESLMRSLETKSAELDRAKAKVEEQEDQIRLIRRDLEGQRISLERERKRLIDESRVQLVEEIEGVRSEIRAIIASLQRTAGSDAVREAMRLATEASARVAKIEADERAKIAAERAESVPGAGGEISEVKVGDWVHVPKLGKDGEVVALDGKDVLVAVGNMRTRIPADSLRRAHSRRPKRGTRSDTDGLRRALADAREKPKPAPAMGSMEIDLRGQTVEESLSRLDAFLDHHYTGGSPRVRIVHGHGTGALRAAVREYLQRSGYVRSFRSGEEGEGGDGATVVELT